MLRSNPIQKDDIGSVGYVPCEYYQPECASDFTDGRALMHTLFNPAEVVTLFATRRMSCITIRYFLISFYPQPWLPAAQSNDCPVGIIG